MVKFSELYITPNGKNLGFSIKVQNSDFYEDVFIDSIWLDTSDTYSSLGVTGKSLLIKLFEEDEEIKLFSTTYDISDLGNKLYFVHILLRGKVAENAPCGISMRYVVGVTYNKYAVYRKSLNLLRTIKRCTPSPLLINYILGLKALDLAIKTGEYDMAIEMWNKVFGKNVTSTINSCNCNG